MKKRIVTLLFVTLTVSQLTGCMIYREMAPETPSDNTANTAESISEDQAEEIEEEINTYNANEALQEIFGCDEEKAEEMIAGLNEKLDLSLDITNISLKEGYPSEQCVIYVDSEDSRYEATVIALNIEQIICGEDTLYRNDDAFIVESEGEVVTYAATTSSESSIEANRSNSLTAMDYYMMREQFLSLGYEFMQETEPVNADEEGTAAGTGSLTIATDDYNISYKDLNNAPSDMVYFQDNGNVVVISHIKGTNYEVAAYYDLSDQRYCIRSIIDNTTIFLDGNDFEVLKNISNILGYWAD